MDDAFNPRDLMKSLAAEQASTPTTPTPVTPTPAAAVEQPAVTTEATSATATAPEVTAPDAASTTPGAEATPEEAPATGAVPLTPARLAGALTGAVPDVYARRRLVALAALVAVIVGGWWLTGHGIPGAAPSRAAQEAAGKAGDTRALNAQADAITALVKNDQAAAAAWLSAHGTLTGFTLAGDGVRFAAAGPTLVASRQIDGVCYMYAATGSGDQPAMVDTSGAACTDAAIADAQADLDAQAAALAVADADAAEATLGAAARTAAAYAINNWVDGAPSLTGIGTDLGTDVVVTENHGTDLVAQTGAGVHCRQATLGADGTLGQITSCS